MLKFSKNDYDFFFSLLEEEEQKALTTVTTIQNDDILIDDENTEVDLYDWLNELVVSKGMDKNYNINNIGKRLEKLSDYVFSVIEEWAIYHNGRWYFYILIFT